MIRTNPLARLLDDAIAADRARPLLTFYDDATGERVELSVATTANWVAKTANLLVDGLGCVPGERVAVLLPLHWQTACVLLGCWSAGLSVSFDPAGAAVAFAAEPDLEAALESGAREVVGLSLRPLGAPLPAVPPGELDYATAVPAYGDRFTSLPLAGPAVEVEERLITATELAAEAHERLPAGARVLTTLPYSTADGLHLGLLAPLAVGARAVLCRHLDEARLAARIEAERVTVVAR